MRPSEVFKNSESLLEQTLELEGWLLSGNETCIQESETTSDHKLRLPHKITQRALIDHVPAYLGGKWLYSGYCSVVGRLSFVNNQLFIRPNTLTFKNLESEIYIIKFQESGQQNC